MLLIGRWPAASRRIWTRSGDGADADAADPAADEPRAQVGVQDLDPEALGGRPARLGHLGRWHADRAAGDRRQLAREPDDRQRVAAVRLDVDVEDDVAVQVGQRRPRSARRPAG